MGFPFLLVAFAQLVLVLLLFGMCGLVALEAKGALGSRASRSIILGALHDVKTGD